MASNKARMIEKLGGIEQYKQWLRDNAKKGGANSTSRPFKDKAFAREQASKGGLKRAQKYKSITHYEVLNG